MKIEQRLADRTLTDAQVAAIAAKLKPFPGQQFEFVTYWDLKEAVNIGSRISVALAVAGWTFVPQKTWSAMTSRLAGVVVYDQPNSSETTKEAAIALVSALNSEDISAELRAGNDTKLNNKITIAVGEKP